ncbi:MAG: ribonuclease H-like domain-containing protein [Rhodospirillales bacterium]|nr:ribonuclease H-like domain-containing protein [Rhodospirillales bacterium]
MIFEPRKIPVSIELHHGDLPAGLDFGACVAVDTETQGLKLGRDRLCVAQFSAGDGVCHLVQFAADGYEAPNVKALMANPKVTKIFHFARFDVVILKKFLGIDVRPIYCTKIASRLVRTYTEYHGLKHVTRELLGVELSKEQQSSDWAAEKLSGDQLKYAAMDVLNLHALKERLDIMLGREGRLALAQSCFDFLNTRGELDAQGWSDIDIFAH